MERECGASTAEIEYNSLMDNLVKKAHELEALGYTGSVNALYRSAMQLAKKGDERLNEIEKLCNGRKCR